jgi:hypothetical protein
MNNFLNRLPGNVMPIYKLSELYPGSRLNTQVTSWKGLGSVVVFFLLLVLWFYGPLLLHRIDGTAGSVDQGIWLLIILSLISFMLITALCWWLLQRFWLMTGLPPLRKLVLRFNTLLLWQQLGFYWLSFVSLLLAAMASLIAIC